MRIYECNNCHYRFPIYADIEQKGFIIQTPAICPSAYIQKQKQKEFRMKQQRIKKQEKEKKK